MWQRWHLARLEISAVAICLSVISGRGGPFCLWCVPLLLCLALRDSRCPCTETITGGYLCSDFMFGGWVSALYMFVRRMFVVLVYQSTGWNVFLHFLDDCEVVFSVLIITFWPGGRGNWPARLLHSVTLEQQQRQNSAHPESTSNGSSRICMREAPDRGLLKCY